MHRSRKRRRLIFMRLREHQSEKTKHKSSTYDKALVIYITTKSPRNILGKFYFLDVKPNTPSAQRHTRVYVYILSCKNKKENCMEMRH